MSSSWETPDFEEIDVGGECTAYAGATTDGETTAGAEPGAAPALWHGRPTVLRPPTAGLTEAPRLVGAQGDLRSGRVAPSGVRAPTTGAPGR
jgi:coenzyme PQQ precursor peptide PqqA